MAAAKAAETGERVTCVSCHTGVSQGHSKRRLVQLCQDCHGGQKARARMLDEWQVGIRAELEHLEALIRRGKARLADGRGLSVGAASSAPRSRPDLRAASSAPRSRPDLRAAEALRKALATSVEAAEVVRQDKSFGAHNLDYLYSVLSEAAEGLTDALGAVGSTTLSPPRGEVGSTTLTSASSVEPSPPRGEIPLSAHARAFTPPSPSFGLGAASSGQRRGPDRAAERRRGQLTR